MEFISNLSNARQTIGLDSDNLKWLEQFFQETVGDQNEISREKFNEIVTSKNPFFTERVFQIFDEDNSGSISLQEFMAAMRQFAGKSPDDKIQFLFRVYDLNGDGQIQLKELKDVMRACMEENGMKFSSEQIDDLTLALFEDADKEGRGELNFEALKAQLLKHPGLLENLSISIDRWLLPPQPQAKPSLWSKITAMRPYKLTWPYIRNNMVFFSFLGLFLAVNIGLFVGRIIKFRNTNTFIIIARACGQCLNFTCVFVLVLMLRRCITFLRARGITKILPLDKHIYFHKITGTLIFIYGTAHSIAHLINLKIHIVMNPHLNPQELMYSEWMLSMESKMFGLIPGIACPTGIALVVILIVMFICSLPFIRRGGCFEIFYWTHLLYVPFWILLILHAPNFWKWFVVPAVVFLLEKITGLLLIWTKLGQSTINYGVLLPSKVTHLVIKRPSHFDFRPGDYVFINIPGIAKYEWHPFTISSAPEQEDTLWLHIRAVGQWTKRLYSFYERELERQKIAEKTGLPASITPVIVTATSVMDLEEGRRTRNQLQLSAHVEGNQNAIPIQLQITIDGPYGAPSSHIFRAEHAVLVGTGIGVTPFASILQSIMHRYWNARQCCPKCEYQWVTDTPASIMKLKKVDFFWINRDQRSFEWFVNLLSQLEIKQAELGGTMERFLDMHMYITSALQKTDMKAVGLQLALDLLHKKEKRDLITGLKTRTKAGRPNWDKVFAQIQDQKKGKVTVFYCGPSQLARVLRQKCDKFGFEFRKEIF